MKHRTFGTVLALGLAAVAWVAWGFVGSSPLALTMTGAIAVVFMLGVHELWQFARATHTLRNAVVQAHAPVPDLAAWLDPVHPSLQAAVRQRIEGARTGLPAPVLTPYLVGLLVMLGMLGTFLGMVLTFKGAAFALEGSTNLDAIRAALAAPIQGLGLSFGTSVAGVATSALLGLLATLCRRDRQDTVRLLDACIAQQLRAFSQTHQRDTLFHALQVQALALPQVVEQLQALRTQLEQRQDQLAQLLLAKQERFHTDTGAAYRELAAHVGQSLQTGLQVTTQAATDNLHQLVAHALSDLRDHAHSLQLQQHAATQAQQQTQWDQWQSTAEQVSATWTQAAQRQQATQDTLVAQLQTTLQGFEATLATHNREVLHRLQQQAEQAHTAQQAATQTLLSHTQALAERQTQAQEQSLQHHGERLDALQAATAQHLATLGSALEAPITRLVQTASQAPQAAAEVIAQLRQEMTQLGERDNRALAERTAMLEQVASLLATVEQASTQQRTAIDALVQSATGVLEQASTRFAQALDAQRDQVNDVAAHVEASAIELSSLGQAFAHGVDRFSQSNAHLVGSLQALESTVQQSLTRSDEQLGYYVAQAREVIDLSLTAQQGLLEDLRRLHAQPAGATA